MSEQQHRSQEQAAQKLRAADQVLAQGTGVHVVARKLGVSGGAYLQPQAGGALPKDSSVQRRHADAEKEMQKGHANSSPNPHARRQENPSDKFPVRRDESSEVFGLFVNVMVADVAAMRAGPSAEISAEIPPKLIRALLYLVQHGGAPMTVGDLAEGLGVSLGWASRVADELASIGFVNRIRQDRDRRVVRLRLTERATEIGQRLWSDREGAIVAALGEVSPEERQAIARFLRRLAAELELHASKTGSTHHPRVRVD